MAESENGGLTERVNNLQAEVMRIRDKQLRPMQLVAPALSAIALIMLLVGSIGGLFVQSLDQQIATVKGDVSEVKTALIPRGELEAGIAILRTELERLNASDALKVDKEALAASLAAHAKRMDELTVSVKELGARFGDSYTMNDLVKRLEDQIDELRERIRILADRTNGFGAAPHPPAPAPVPMPNGAS